ncbi:MAG TPA: hypothetical protein DCY13_07425 [Verrucomicrobiales bacterium]|nr:hypothetical protein [Verrucomicrobiales bacterium]
MRSWTPRRPSPALEERLFGEVKRAAAEAPAADCSRLPGWGWLAPVACAFVLALQLAPPLTSPRFPTGDGTTAAVHAGSGGHALLAYAPGWANSAMNNVNGETFESTNWTAPPSPMRTLPVFLTLTNGLIQ